MDRPPRYHAQGSPSRGVVSVVVDARGSDSPNVLTIKEEHVVGRGTSVTCGGVTVTSINVPDSQRPSPEGKSCKYYEGVDGEVAVKCEMPPADDDSGSDAEVSNIDFSRVEMRMKRARGPGDGGEGPPRQQPERPMSWEGELLSDTEMSIVAGNNGGSGASGNGGLREDERMDVQDTGSLIVQSQRMRNDHHHHHHHNHHHNHHNHHHHPNHDLPLLVDKVLGSYCTPSQSPILPRGLTSTSMTKQQQQHLSGLPPNPSPDSAIHSAYSYSSPVASPATSRHLPSSGFSSPFTPSLSRNNSDASQYGGSQHSSCYSYSSSPTHSPVQSRHLLGLHPISGGGGGNGGSGGGVFAERDRDRDRGGDDECLEEKLSSLAADLAQHASPGISRQQLINSPCPICGDKISGFHYGIFSCESCKGFFKRTVQNRKNYVCLRGSQCPVTIATRKKCPACRFEKCLKMGMKLEAIREDRTRGGRSTYQCSYSVPSTLLPDRNAPPTDPMVKLEAPDGPSGPNPSLSIPPLLQEMMEVEHLWHYNEREMLGGGGGGGGSPSSTPSSPSSGPQDPNSEFLANLCNIADHRLYKIVKWCKSLPLFKNISIDDQISLLINSWCELLLFSCCFRSMATPGEIRVSLGKSLSLDRGRELGLGSCIERMLNFTQHLRRLRLDKYEYVAMKVIVLLTSDVNELREPEKVRASQEKALQALQHYTLHHYPDMPSKFGELLLRIPELQRTCQVGKEVLSFKNNKEGEEAPSFNLLVELLRGDH